MLQGVMAPSSNTAQGTRTSPQPAEALGNLAQPPTQLSEQAGRPRTTTRATNPWLPLQAVFLGWPANQLAGPDAEVPSRSPKGRPVHQRLFSLSFLSRIARYPSHLSDFDKRTEMFSQCYLILFYFCQECQLSTLVLGKNTDCYWDYSELVVGYSANIADPR